jgi:hypothetical protein
MREVWTFQTQKVCKDKSNQQKDTALVIFRYARQKQVSDVLARLQQQNKSKMRLPFLYFYLICCNKLRRQTAQISLVYRNLFQEKNTGFSTKIRHKTTYCKIY